AQAVLTAITDDNPGFGERAADVAKSEWSEALRSPAGHTGVRAQITMSGSGDDRRITLELFKILNDRTEQPLHDPIVLVYVPAEESPDGAAARIIRAACGESVIDPSGPRNELLKNRLRRSLHLLNHEGVC